MIKKFAKLIMVYGRCSVLYSMSSAKICLL